MSKGALEAGQTLKGGRAKGTDGKDTEVTTGEGESRAFQRSWIRVVGGEVLKDKAGEATKSQITRASLDSLAM